MPLAPRRIALALAALACALPASAQTVSLFGSTGYVNGGDVYANQPSSTESSYRATRTFGINASTTTTTTRALSVAADSNINGGTLGGAGLASYTGTMPPVFGGFTATANGSDITSSITVRTQFQNGSASNDFININAYQESASNTIAAGLEFRLTAALMFSVGGSPLALSGLTSLSYAAGGISYAAGTGAVHRVVVRDSVSGNFFVSSANQTAAGATINGLGTSEWASLTSGNLNTLGSFSAAAFSSIDYIGIYSDSSVITADAITGFTRVNGFTLSSLDYSVIPEPAGFTAIAALAAAGGVALRRRRR